MPRRPSLFEPLEPRALLAVITWDGGGGDNIWSNPLNWQGDVLPGVGDTAAINLPGSNPVIKFTSGTVEIASLKCQESLEISGGTLKTTAGSWMNGALTLGGTGTLDAAFWKQNGALNSTFGGTITGAGPFIIAGGGLWNGGYMLGTGKTQLVAAGFTVDGNMHLERPFIQGAALNWTTGDITLLQGARFHVLAGQTIQMPGGLGGFGGWVGGLFLSGALVGSGFVGANIWAGGPGASISVAAGKHLSVAGGSIACPVHIASLALFSTGSSGSMAGMSLQPGAQVSGPGLWAFAGTLRVLASGLNFNRVQVGYIDSVGGKLVVERDAAIGQLLVVLGDVLVAGGETLTISKKFGISNGVITSFNGVGTVLVQHGATMTVSNVFGLGGARVLVRNEGAVVFDMAASKLVLVDIENHGVVTKKGVGQATIVGLTGDGAVYVQQGMLVVGSPPGNAGYGGAMSVSAGAKALLRDAFRLLPSGSVAGAGAVQFGLVTDFTLLLEGTVQVAIAQVSSRVFVKGGGFAPGKVTVDDFGFLRFLGAADSAIAGNVGVSGALGGGRIGFEIGGQSPSQYSSLDVGGTLSLGEASELSLVFTNGFVPTPGAAFDFLTFGTRLGLFSGVIVDGLPQGLSASIVYLARGVRVVIEEA